MSNTISSGGGSGGGGSGATLSNDALYAPLSTYADCTSTTTTMIATPPGGGGAKQKQQQQQQHSLALQTSASLRESSLLTYVSSSICTNLKTCHPHEYVLYRSIGGKVAQYGMGDGNHDGVSYSNSIRSLLENKLSNRSLVLVGGGVVQSTASVGKRTGNGMGGSTTTMMMQQQQQLQHASSMTTVASTSSSSGISSKRVRKRAGGNGIFGCISNKRRKKILKETILAPRGKKKDEHSDHRDELNIRDGKIQQKLPIISTQSSPEQQTTTQPSAQEVVQRLSSMDEIIADTGGNNMEREFQEKVGSVIETIHTMWISYIRALCSFSNLMPSSSKFSTTTTLNTTNINTAKTTYTHTSPLSLNQRKQLSYLLATSEHVGMVVTIAQCPSRRHLIRKRSIVVQETNETWTMALLVPKKRRRKKKKLKKIKHDGVSKPNEVVEAIDTTAVVEVVPPPPSSEEEEDAINSTWKIVMVPKRGTVLDVTLPWGDSLTLCA